VKSAIAENLIETAAQPFNRHKPPVIAFVSVLLDPMFTANFVRVISEHSSDYVRPCCVQLSEQRIHAVADEVLNAPRQPILASDRDEVLAAAMAGDDQEAFGHEGAVSGDAHYIGAGRLPISGVTELVLRVVIRPLAGVAGAVVMSGFRGSAGIVN
jgi:hypothetical protein